MDVDKAIENTDLYQAIEMLKFYYSIIYKTELNLLKHYLRRNIVVME